MAMIDSKLIFAAKSGAGDFMSEWISQGGSKDPDDIKSAFDFFSNPNALKKATNKFSGGSNTTSAGPLDTGNFAQDLLRTQMRAKSGEMGEFGSLEKGLEVFFDKAGKLRGPMDMLKQMGGLIKNEILVYLDQQSKLLTKINEDTGMTGKLSEEFRDEIMKASPDVIRLGISFEELSQSVSNVVSESGKFKLLSSDTIKEMALASKFAKDMTEMAAMGKVFQDAGYGIKDMSLMIEKMGLKSMTLGLNARTTTKMVNENLAQLNSYGFKNGIEGLNKMTQKSIEFRMNMTDVFKMAEKVWSPEGALEMAANLQVIGGAFGALNDPIKMMYIATNDVEGLQEAITGAAKSLVTYNQEQGRFQITGANLRRAKEMADQFGMSMQDLTKTAVASMERTQAATDLLSSGLTMKDDDKEFLTNLAQMKGGKMVIEVPENLRKQLGVVGDETSIALQDMGQKQVEALLEQKRAFERLEMIDVARAQVTALENIERDVSFIRAVARVGVGRGLGDAIEKIVGINQDMIGKESKVLFDNAAGSLNSGMEWLKNKVTSRYPERSLFSQKGTIETGEKVSNVSNEQKKEAPKTGKPEETVTRNIVELKVSTADVSMDTMARYLFANPAWMEKIPGDYLNNPLPSKN